MSIVDFFLVLVFVAVLAVVVLAANYADQKRDARMAWAVFGVVLLLNALLVLNSGFMLLAAYDGIVDQADPPNKPAAVAGLLAALVIATLTTALLWRPVRERVAVLFPRYRGKQQQDTPEAELDGNESVDIKRPQSQTSGEPLFPQMLNYYTSESDYSSQLGGGSDETSFEQPQAASTGASYYVRGFNPASYVHMLALVLVLFMLGSQLVDFIVSGGLEGLAQTYEEQGLNVWALLSNAVPFIVLSFLGVGLGLRRNWRESLKRLGLGPVTGEGLGISLGVTFALFIGVIVIGALWMFLLPEDIYEQQTQATEAMSASVTSIGLAIMIAASAAVGEEIAFRGALQPVLGFWPTAFVFVLTHTQYTLTPAWFIILGVALAFGWIRQRFNTSVAILTHFWYNLFQLLLVVVGQQETTDSILHMFL